MASLGHATDVLIIITIDLGMYLSPSNIVYLSINIFSTNWVIIRYAAIMTDTVSSP